jgi:hypothetical protein
MSNPCNMVVDSVNGVVIAGMFMLMVVVVVLMVVHTMGVTEVEAEVMLLILRGD